MIARHARTWRRGLPVAGLALALGFGCATKKAGPALSAGVGLSADADAAKAGEEAVKQALDDLKESGAAPQLVVAYLGHKDKDASALSGVKRAAGTTPFVACQSYVGHMVSPVAGGGKFGGPETVGALALGGSAKITCARATGILADLRAAGAKVGKALKASDNKALFILVAAPASHKEPDIRDLLKGIREHVPATVPIVGGNAENGKDAGVVFDGEAAMPEGVIGIMFSGDLKVGIGSAINFDKAAGPFKITRMEGRKLYEVDGKPVADVYTKELGVAAADVDGGYAAQQPIAVKIGGKYVIRYQRALKADGTFEGFPHPLEVGQEVFLLKYNNEKIVPSARASAEEAKAALGGRPLLTLSSVCIGRAGFGKQQQGETDAIRSAVGDNVPLFGLYACGEYFTPQWGTPEVSTEYHQLSSCVMVIGE